ncbi:hypothetical protein RSal33209_2850 [Renibacterium salmoninarum ATCC 33209]|uniref:Uncharacterized protein n=1 Tax=Renibacterium salmoninarum (strain ATCC 33209 / DSM 20767 / JCM 11484 / NBRC 15589 / NCIMB 2235) TaxID=288705 RepID=A9WTQ3_RENSM|nr:hypothetical protein RSal33209_2850 [Renibacterium salmoninarum ATCC 33209]
MKFSKERYAIRSHRKRGGQLGLLRAGLRVDVQLSFPT